MDQALKQRLIGAAIIVALVVLIVPVFLPGPGERDATQDIDLPEPPRVEREPRLLPINQSPADMPEPVDNSRQPVDEGISNTADPGIRQPQVSSEQAAADTGSPAGTTEAQASDPPPQQQTQPEPVDSQPSSPSADQSPAEVEAEPADVEPVREPETAAEVGSFAVQVGAFGNEDNALGLRDRLREAGFPTFVEFYTGGSQAVYRVRVGPAVDRNAAEGLLQRLQAEMDVNGRVVTHP